MALLIKREIIVGVFIPFLWLEILGVSKLFLLINLNKIERDAQSISEF